jgi:UDP-hydrolysing UDP-N-acetyl-D-glucosamine 2-epimerase
VSDRRRVAVVTGSRAEFGLLRPVMRAVRDHPGLELAVIAAGSHLVSPAQTYRDVKADFEGLIADAIPMQTAGRTGRLEDAEATGVGVARFARSFTRVRPDWVVVLGDRIEALAAAVAAAIGGIALAHVHGGDRAEGVADEAMRHAITKLAHLHLPATEESAQRIIRMGERPEQVVVVGSPAVDGLDSTPPLDERTFSELGDPEVLLLLHPIGRDDASERRACEAILGALPDRRVLALHPNLDPGREGIVAALAGANARVLPHLPRDRFIGVLKRLATNGGMLIGNSSAALIEGAAMRLRAVDIGPRQAGRERAGNVVHSEETAEDVARALTAASSLDLSRLVHPFGDGRAGTRIALRLATVDPRDPGLLRKRCTY